MPQRRITIYLFFSSITPCVFLSTSTLDLIVVRLMSDVINDVCIHCSLKNQLVSTLIFITLIFFSTTDHIWNFLKLYKRVFLRHVEVSFFFYNIKRTCRWLYMYNFNTFSYNIVVVTFFSTSSIEYLCKQRIEWISCAMNLK
jgi:hypothetical protein